MDRPLTAQSLAVLEVLNGNPGDTGEINRRIGHPTDKQHVARTRSILVNLQKKGRVAVSSSRGKTTGRPKKWRITADGARELDGDDSVNGSAPRKSRKVTKPRQAEVAVAPSFEGTEDIDDVLDAVCALVMVDATRPLARNLLRFLATHGFFD